MLEVDTPTLPISDTQQKNSDSVFSSIETTPTTIIDTNKTLGEHATSGDINPYYYGAEIAIGQKKGSSTSLKQELPEIAKLLQYSPPSENATYPARSVPFSEQQSDGGILVKRELTQNQIEA